MMGLARVFAIVGAFTDSDVAWTLNTALNSLQGAFIFVASDCNQITVQKLAVFRKQPFRVRYADDHSGHATQCLDLALARLKFPNKHNV
ncbi:unnamed protein product [Macrosiphum euphorbiae]|uniref:Uncharacterized protein n=1 Tax=Macrosiphum euphorbiae TaxID=13131 RepID=A0AAV0XZ92_9HEMI|nr:unnamed protein product [Macrosiphum euphorbiae]